MYHSHKIHKFPTQSNAKRIPLLTGCLSSVHHWSLHSHKKKHCHVFSPSPKKERRNTCCNAGTGKEVGDRHPKVNDNVLIGASATILGNISIGKGAQVAAGSLVLKNVPPRTMVAGSPAKEVGKVTGECLHQEIGSEAQEGLLVYLAVWLTCSAV